MNTIQSKSIARDIVQEVAPKEIGQFEGMWKDYEELEIIDEADSRDRAQGFGADLVHFTWMSSIIIPVVVAYSKQMVSAAVDSIYHYIKDLLSKKKGAKPGTEELLTDDEIKALAEKIAKRLKK